MKNGYTVMLPRNPPKDLVELAKKLDAMNKKDREDDRRK